MGRPSRRARISHTPLACALDKFLDVREESSSLQVDSAFNVATLARPRGSGAVMVLGGEGHGGGAGLFDGGSAASESAAFRALDLVGQRQAETVADVAALGDAPDGCVLVADEGSFHPYRGVTRPATSHMARPDTSDRLLRPQERRAELQFEKAAKTAEKLMQSVAAEKARAVRVLKHQFGRGIAGVDSTNNTESPTFGDIARQNARVRARTAHLQGERAARIAKHTSSMASRGFNFIEQRNGVAKRSEFDAEAWFPRKQRVETAPTNMHDTHARLFARDFVKAKGVRRRNDLGRTFDIVTGCKAPALPLNNM